MKGRKRTREKELIVPIKFLLITLDSSHRWYHKVLFPRSVQLNITYAKDCDGATSQENQEILLVLEELIV